MIIVIGNIVAKPDAHEAVMALGREHCARSRAEPGCIAHNISQDCENQGHFTFVEYWEDMAALGAHFAVPASQQFVKDLSQYLSEPPEMRIFDASELKSPV